MAAVDGVVRGEPLLGVRGRSLGVRGHLRLGVLAGEFDRVRMDVALLAPGEPAVGAKVVPLDDELYLCLLYTSDAADE